MRISLDIKCFHTLDLNPYNPLPTATFGSNHHLQAIGIGSVKFLLPGSVHSRPSTMILDNVLYMPQAAADLFSVKQVSEPGEAVVFAEDQCFIYKNQVLLFKSATNSHTNYISAETDPGPYTLKDVFSPPACMLFQANPRQAALTARVHALPAGTEVWHARMGHLGLDNMGLMINKEMVDGFPLTKAQLDETRKNPDL